MEHDPEAALEETVDEMEERVDALGDHIEDAEAAADERREQDAVVGDVAGDYEETHPEGGLGEDPEGAGRTKG